MLYFISMRLLVYILLFVSSDRIRLTASEPVDLTYYQLLEVPPNATQQDIRQAFKKLAVRYHPDKNRGEDVSAQFVKISEAYEILKDPRKKREYDLYGPDIDDSHSNYYDLLHKGLYANDPHVEDLDEKSFHQSREEISFVNFYSPFCPPCKKLSFIWKKLAKAFSNIVKIGVVNCKKQDNLCLHDVHITSYPSLYLYNNGRKGAYTAYKGERSYDSLHGFVMSHLKEKVRLKYNKIYHVQEKLIVYFMDEYWHNKDVIIKFAHKVREYARVVIITYRDLWEKLTENMEDEQISLVVDVIGTLHHFSNVREEDISQTVSSVFPVLPAITTDALKEIRNDLRNYVGQNGWMIHFRKEKLVSLLPSILKNKFEDLNFGEINCLKDNDLCLSLQVDEPPSWAIIKPGGAYERYFGKIDVTSLSNFIISAKETENVQTLSVSEFRRIMKGEAGLWVVVVVPHNESWSSLRNSFTVASYAYKYVQFGIMLCKVNTKRHCDPIAQKAPVIVVHNNKHNYFYREIRQIRHSLTNFIDTILDNSAVEFTEKEFNDLIIAKKNEVHWLVAFFPQDCSKTCAEMKYEFKEVAKKLSPFDNIRVGIHHCTADSGLCSQSNVDSPIVRVYPANIPHSYVAHLDSIGSSAYITEWLLSLISPTIQQLSHREFIDIVRATPVSPAQQSTKPWLVYFHSSKCYHCYELYTDFYVVATMLQDHVQTGRIDCIKHELTCTLENIRSYPSIKLYKTEESYQKAFNFDPKSYPQLLKDIKPFVDVKMNEVKLGALTITGHPIGYHDEL